MSTCIRVLGLDDHLVVRRGIRSLLETEPEIAVVGEACNGVEAVEETARLEPDVSLMDLVMPTLDGIEAIRQILGIQPQARILVLTCYEADEQVFPVIRSGALGHTLKDFGPEEVVRAIHRTHRGESSLHAAIAWKVLQELMHPPHHPPTPDPLTEREVDVLALGGTGRGQSADRCGTRYQRGHGARAHQQYLEQIAPGQPHAGRPVCPANGSNIARREWLHSTDPRSTGIGVA